MSRRMLATVVLALSACADPDPPTPATIPSLDEECEAPETPTTCEPEIVTLASGDDELFVRVHGDPGAEAGFRFSVFRKEASRGPGIPVAEDLTEPALAQQYPEVHRRWRTTFDDPRFWQVAGQLAKW